jgi:predicted lysophospholipase L1 biosynthesis ABC-type transport system permease subunit
MRRTASDSTFSEALDAASGGLLFFALVVAIGALVGLAGWAAGTYPMVGILFGCATLSTLVASAVWGILHWGVDDAVPVKRSPARQAESGVRFNRAA